MSTSRYGFSTVPTNTLNPSVPINDFMRLVDALLDTEVEQMDLAVPPTTGDIDAGKVWIPASGASGDWTAHDGDIAICVAANQWIFVVPPEGKRVRNKDDSLDYIFDGSAWAVSASGGSAASISYDNSTSGLAATNVQDAIDEVAAGGGGGGAPWFISFKPYDNEPPATNYATLGIRNSRPTLDFDTTTQEAAVFSGVLPTGYAGGGVRVTVFCALATATTGTVGWDVAFERTDASGLDIDADSFATAQTITATTVPSTSGKVLALSVNVANGADMDGLIAGELFRIRVRRDVASDTAAGDAQLLAVSIREQ